MLLEEQDVIDYQTFVQNKLKYIERYIALIKNDQITPEAINHALSSYESVGNWLISEYESVCLEQECVKEEFQIDFDEWFLKASEQINEKRIKSNFASKMEIEAKARVDNRENYLRWQRKLKILDRKVSLYRRIMDNWKSQKDMIVNLSQNSRAEMRALGIQDLANYDEKESQSKPIVKKLKKRLED